MMASLSEDIQSAGSDTRPPMLDRSIKMRKFRETLADGALGLERDRVIKDLTPEEKKRFKADIHAINIILQEQRRNHSRILCQYPTQSSTIPQSAYAPPVIYPTHFADNTHLNSRLINVQGRQNRVQGNNARGAVAARNKGVQNRVGNANPGQEKPTKPCSWKISAADPIYDEAGPSYDSDIISEVQDHDTIAMHVQSALYNGHEIVKTNHALAVVRDSEDTLELAEITRKKILEKMKSPLFSELHDAYTVEQARKVELEAEISKLKHKIQNDDHGEMIKHFSNLELQGIRKLKEQTSHMNERRSEEDHTLDFKALDSQNIELTEHVTALQEQNEHFRGKNEKGSAKGKIECVTMNTVTPKVLAPSMYAIDVEPILPRHRNNRKVHLDYLKHLKECVETLREIVKVARIETKLDNGPANAYFYTKESQELLEYWKPTGKKFSLGEQCPLTKFTKSKVVPLQQPKHVSSSEIVITERFSNTSHKPLTRLLKTYDGNRSQLKNMVKKFIRTVRFRNDHFGAIMGYEDYVVGDRVISRVYYVEGLRHNLFSVGQLYDLDLEVAFIKHSCYVRDVGGVELLKGSRGSNLYTTSVEDMMNSSPICLLSKASKNKSWLWHRRLNHLNFGTINDLVRKDLVRGLPRLKFEKDHLCSACQLGKSMNVGIIHQKSIPRTPQKNDVVERRNCTLVEVAWIMMIFSKALMFLWAEAVATACYTKNRSIIHTRNDKTPYELVHGKKLDLTFLCIFGALCYPINDSEDLGKLKAKADIGIFVGYAPNRKGYRIYNKRTRRIIETIHVQYDELTEHMAPVHIITGPEPILMTPGQISLGIIRNPVPSAPYVPPTNKDL
uniref:Integrase, catalytic region, zinc finger, CCHC-type, peptidase aspartic, catalytic n=1 Tax=Tanacetum cinerariifolium TaxID=118510 RepID=A0A6L2LJA2_TANCI|nr:integrase, catalytic region, zinc finger, CCHC-type, peptidase aspartic, catalytic [Tanacetum cinerariifolium]